ncbi:MAG: LegC family aminotransferase [Saprospiraceae bacterium]|nr:LegC family aminotransferase [Saprospiraceae bacterium]
MKKIPLSEPFFDGNEWKYVKDCLDTGWVSSAGKYVDLFEEKVCEYTGARFAVAVMNGTAALHLALKLYDIGPGDEVIVPTLTFIAPINCVNYVGAEPVFMDCDDYYNIDTGKVLKFLVEETLMLDGESETGEDNVCINRKSGNRIAAIIPVHVFGNACDLEMLLPECRKRNIKIIEDATESLGTCYNSGILNERYTGTIGDIGCYSFNGNKIITTGGGGMLVTNDEKLAKRARYLSTQAKNDPLYYMHNEVGYNYRMTNIQAALGVAQMELLEEFIKMRSAHYEDYIELMQNNRDYELVKVPEYAEQNHWLNALRCKKSDFNRNRLIEKLLSNGIEVRPVWQLNHLQEPYKNNIAYNIEKAEQLCVRTVNIPSSVNLDKEDIRLIISQFEVNK